MGNQYVEKWKQEQQEQGQAPTPAPEPEPLEAFKWHPNPHPRVDAHSLPVIYRTIAEEAERGREVHGAYHSTHEGLGVLVEEVAELVDEIRKNNMPGVFLEAVQVAAVAAKLAEFAYAACQARKGGQANG